jgi:hypothetical protein
MLYKGKGISVDRVQAYLWINKAFIGLKKDTGQRIPAGNQAVLADLKRGLTKEEINQIKEQQINWLLKESKLYLTYSNRP